MKRFFIIRTALLVAALVAITFAPSALVVNTSKAATAVSATTTATTNSSLQAQINTNNQQIADLNQQIATYQANSSKSVPTKKPSRRPSTRSTCSETRYRRRSPSPNNRSHHAIADPATGRRDHEYQQTIATDQAALGAKFLRLQKADRSH